MSDTPRQLNTLMCKNEKKPELEQEPCCEKTNPGAGATLMKTKRSAARAGAKFMKRRAPKPELCPFHGDSAALLRTVMFNTPQSVRL